MFWCWWNYSSGQAAAGKRQRILGFDLIGCRFGGKKVQIKSNSSIWREESSNRNRQGLNRGREANGSGSSPRERGKRMESQSFLEYQHHTYALERDTEISASKQTASEGPMQNRVEIIS